jgi:thiol-disulfide isomerase/thioredoxin
MYPADGKALYRLINQKTMELRDYKGQSISEALKAGYESQVDVIRIFHFWAGWCDPCILEMPEVLQFIQSIEAKNKLLGANKKIEVYLISLDANREDLEKAVKIFPDLLRLNFVQIWDQAGVLSREAAVEKLPITFVDIPRVKMQIYEGAADWKSILSNIHGQSQ